MLSKSRTAIILFTTLLASDLLGQTNPVPDRKEQELIMAQSAANAEKRDRAAAALLVEVQSAVAANAPIKAYDALLLKISALSLENKDRYGQNPRVDLLRSFTTHYQDYLFSLDQQNFELAGQALGQLVQESALFPVIPRSELLVMQKKLTGQSAEYDTTVLAPLLRKLDEAISGPALPAGLDSLLAEVDTTQVRERSTHPNRNSLISSLQEIRQFCVQLQEYSAMRENGKTSEAQNIFRNLSNAGNYGNLSATTPARTKLMKLGMNNPVSKAPEIPQHPVAGTQALSVQPKPAEVVLKPESLTLENLDNVADALKTTTNPEMSRVFSATDSLRKARDFLANQQISQALRQLSFDNARMPGLDGGGYANAVNVIRRKLLTQAIVLQSDAKLTPQTDETPDDFLRRTVRAQIDAKNWRGAYDTLKLVEAGIGTFAQDDYSVIPILLSLVTAPNQEAAGQYVLVTQSYFRALKCPSTLLPADEILARLAKIKAEHPAEYKDGQFAAENPPPIQPYVPGHPGFPTQRN